MEKTINELLIKLSKVKNNKDKTLIGIELSNEILKIFGAPNNELRYGEEALNEAFPSRKFKHQKMEAWFAKHPYIGSARVAIDLFDSSTIPVEANFYRLNESGNKAKISASTQIGSNWEDSELTRRPQYPVGVDFFLSSDADSLLVVLTNKGNLRVLEISERLSVTQLEILTKLKDCFMLEGKIPQELIHNRMWAEFALQEVNKKFYEGVADHFDELVHFIENNPPKEINIDSIKSNSKLFTNRLIGRLLFIWFLRKRNIISTDYDYFSQGEQNATDYYHSKLKKLFFEVLNTPINQRKSVDIKTPYLNGGLFDAHDNDWADTIVFFPKFWFESLFQHFNKFNFTTDESSSDYEQIAIDPEMLGRVFENLLATIVPETSKAANEKKNKGAFYTPREIVDFMTKEALKSYLKTYHNVEKDFIGIDKLIDMNDAEFLEARSTGVVDFWGNRSTNVKDILIKALNKLKIIDPACGSGAFPIGTLQLMIKTYERLSAFYDKRIKTHRLVNLNEKNDIYETKLAIIRNNLFGSDIEPMAIEISRLRSWLTLIVDDKGEIDPLPNLDFNYVCANSLIPLDESTQISMFDNLEYEKQFEALREQYFDSHTHDEKMSLKAKFNQIYETANDFGEDSKRIQQLKSWNPFKTDKPADFFNTKIMFNTEFFDIAIGNPPYIQMKYVELKNEYSKLNFKTFTRSGDIYTLFIEYANKNLSKNGVGCFITSNKWIQNEYGGFLRQYLIENTSIEILIDFRGTKIFDSANVDTSIVLWKKKKWLDSFKYSTFKDKDFTDFDVVSTDFEGSQPWIFANKIESSIKKKIEKKSTPMIKKDIKFHFGVNTGFNPAFIISEDDIKRKFKTKKIYKYLVPVLRGQDIERYKFNYKNLYLINLHNGLQRENIEPVIVKDEEIINYFKGFGQRFLNRGEQGDNWYNLRNCSYLDVFSKPKIIYADISKNRGKFYYDKDNFYTFGSAFIIYSETVNMKFLTGLLNSKPISFLYKKFYAGLKLGDDAIRYKKVFLERLPLPFNMGNNNIDLISEIVQGIQDGTYNQNYEKKIDDILYVYFKFDKTEIDYIENEVMDY